MMLANGVEVLLHVGIDTVDMQGDGFSYLVHTGDEVKAGTPLLTFSRAKIKAAGHSDVTVCVITNKNEVLAAELLKQLNLDGYFSLVLGGDSLTEKKPSPLPLQHAAEVLGIDVANMLMVGDSKNDIIAAKAAGCFSVGITFGYGDMTLLSQDKATKPDLLIRALPEIYENLQPQKNKDKE